MEAKWENSETGSSNSRKTMTSPCDVDALRKCLAENKGDRRKCQSHIEAFKNACSINKSSDSPPKIQS
ncbi:hypothetical protein ABFX02_06G108700 [Erythranthe guttata]